MFKSVGLGVVFLVLSLLTAEGLVRVVPPKVTLWLQDTRRAALFIEWDEEGEYWRRSPNTEMEGFGTTLRFNSFGVRAPEPVIPKPANTRRIMCLGDSIAAGAGVPVDDAYPQRIARLLSGRGTDVVVGAVGGWNTTMEAHFLAHNIDRLAPDLLVLLYVTNDNEQQNPYGITHRPQLTFWSDVHRALAINSRLYEWAAWAYQAKIAPTNTESLREWFSWQHHMTEGGPDFAPTEPGWLESRASLMAIRDLCQTRKVPLVIFLWNLGEFPPGPTALERLREFDTETGVPIYDTAALYRDKPPLEFTVLPFIDAHPSVEGHDRLAREMVRVLDELRLLP